MAQRWRAGLSIGRSGFDFPLTLTACGPSDGKEVKDVFGRGRLGTLKTSSCLWFGCPAAGQNLDTGHLSRHYISEISLNVTLNHNQQQQQQLLFKYVVIYTQFISCLDTYA